MAEILIIILCMFQILLSLILNRKADTLMSAEATVQAMITEVLAIVEEAFNTNVGDLTEAEAQAKKDEFIARINSIVNPS